MTVRTLEPTPLSGSLGAELNGIQLADLVDADFDALCEAFWDHQVLVLREQRLEPEQHIALGRRFGELHYHPHYNHLRGHPEILYIRSSGKANNVTEVWHSDVTSENEPPAISILHAVQLPPAGGDTMWADQYTAYDLLSETMKKVLEPLDAVHDALGLTAIHPIVRTHPITGRKALFVNPGFTVGISGMTDDESRPLLEFLYEHSSRPELTFRHTWRQNDVVMWDNRCVTHYAIHDYGDDLRIMHRVTVQGDRPRR